MGLLMRDGQDGYRIAHQIIEAYLAELSAASVKKLRRRRIVRYTAAGVCIVMLLTAGGYVYRRYVRAYPYDETQARMVFERAVAGFGYAAGLNESAQAFAADALANAQAGAEPSESARQMLERQISQGLNTLANAEISVLFAEDMMNAVDRENEVMPWSYAPFDAGAYGELVYEAGRRAESYQEYMTIIDFMLRDADARKNYYLDYLEQLDALAKVDGEIVSTLYTLTCAPHMDGIRTKDAQAYEEYMKNIAMLGVEGQSYESGNLQPLREKLEILRGKREEIEGRLNASGAVEAYRRRG